MAENSDDNSSLESKHEIDGGSIDANIVYLRVPKTLIQNAAIVENTICVSQGQKYTNFNVERVKNDIQVRG